MCLKNLTKYHYHYHSWFYPVVSPPWFLGEKSSQRPKRRDSSSFPRVQVLAPYKRLDSTRTMYSSNLVVRWMSFAVQIGWSLWTAPSALPTLLCRYPCLIWGHPGTQILTLGLASFGLSMKGKNELWFFLRNHKHNILNDTNFLIYK